MRSTARRQNPGMLRVAAGKGSSIEMEVWALPAAAFGNFVAAIPPPLSIGTVRLAEAGASRALSSSPPISMAPAIFPLPRLARVRGGEKITITPSFRDAPLLFPLPLREKGGVDEVRAG